jgi:NADH-quinone oxidoreductase subunit L
MLAGTLAITGVGVIGVFGFAGFYSKDAILEAAFASGSEIGRTRSGSAPSPRC